jgi:hypothetical protein
MWWIFAVSTSASSVVTDTVVPTVGDRCRISNALRSREACSLPVPLA